MKRVNILALSLLLWLSACQLPFQNDIKPGTSSGAPMGMGTGMMGRHHAQVPEDYAGLTNPVPSDEESLRRGEVIYNANCASCHGDSGMGGGPAGISLDPPASPIAHTSQMMGDDYLLWRISEGGTAFNTSMPAWETSLDEQARWDAINYIRALGEGKAGPETEANAEDEAALHTEMLARALEQNIITTSEAQTFEKTHTILEEYLRLNTALTGRNMDERQATALEELVAAGDLTQDQADTFLEVHERLVESGLMP